jgi:N-acetyl-gamma-glutamyl-phosphate reductase
VKRTKIFIDGSEGTTGLRIHQRFQNREDIEVLTIVPQLRKDPKERQVMMKEADITILCLPDAAAIESAALWSECGNTQGKLIDTSTAHRIAHGWTYGFPELSGRQTDEIVACRRVAVPGCFPTGFIGLTYPLIQAGIMPPEYPISCFAITGYSGGGKARIAEYQDKERRPELNVPREYAMTQQHKHLKEMQLIPGFKKAPLFSPIIADFYSGMLVTIPIYTELLLHPVNLKSIWELYHEYYEDKPFIKVADLDAIERMGGMLAADGKSGLDDMELYVSGCEDRILLSARYDNLGKGASGAAVQCLNLMMGCEETKGLQIS